MCGRHAQRYVRTPCALRYVRTPCAARMRGANTARKLTHVTCMQVFRGFARIGVQKSRFCMKFPCFISDSHAKPRKTCRRERHWEARATFGRAAEPAAQPPHPRHNRRTRSATAVPTAQPPNPQRNRRARGATGSPRCDPVNRTTSTARYTPHQETCTTSGAFVALVALSMTFSHFACRSAITTKVRLWGC